MILTAVWKSVQEMGLAFFTREAERTEAKKNILLRSPQEHVCVTPAATSSSAEVRVNRAEATLLL